MCQPAADWAKKPGAVPYKSTWEGQRQDTYKHTLISRQCYWQFWQFSVFLINI